MAADDGGRSQGPQPPPTRAAQVCANCKARKKKCNKALPKCGYCFRKGQSCCYETIRPQRPRDHAFPALGLGHGSNGNTLLSPYTKAYPAVDPAAASEASLYLEVHRLICETGQSVDDLSARYFQGIHQFLPFVSRARFHDSISSSSSVTLMGAGATPTPPAGFSVLLLSICLITLPLSEGAARQQESLYLTAKSLLAQAQVLFGPPPSVSLVQAGLLLAVYEYTHGRPGEALVSIAGCARMAYAARIHHMRRRDRGLAPRMLPEGGTPRTRSAAVAAAGGIGADLRLEAEEAANTWWAIVICERLFFCEATVCDQPLVTVFPSGDAWLPVEPEILNKGIEDTSADPGSVPYYVPVPVSSLSCVDVRGFGRAAQAACLLDKILKGFNIPNLGARLLHLQGLDAALQVFLGLLLKQCEGEDGVFCEALTITIRSLYTLHWHILSQASQAINASSESQLQEEEWYRGSRMALDAVTNMVIDIVDSHMAKDKGDRHLCVTLAPTYSYIVRAALRYVQEKKMRWQDDGNDDNWPVHAEERLRIGLEHCDVGR
ncbi:hypothetical protein SLS62_003479 [Diatrype stigma]|uniref:Zn(2)-C6 fungal-type domain-containing protein n=1 Tax=Diatrype stigma TaxID=117547 RepID=A0AAN9YU69_9PEZI